jgi:hypothetical protein
MFGHSCLSKTGSIQVKIKAQDQDLVSASTSLRIDTTSDLTVMLTWKGEGETPTQSRRMGYWLLQTSTQRILLEIGLDEV